MKHRIVALLVVGMVLYGIDNPKTVALQSGQNGVFLPCGSTGSLLSNLGAEPTDFDLGADWSGTCALSLSWPDADGKTQTITFQAPPPAGGPSSFFQPAHGLSSTLNARGVITWTTAVAAAGTSTSGALNVQFERPPGSLDQAGEVASPNYYHYSTTGSVGGKLGQFANGTTSGENVSCGSSGTLYRNLTSVPVTFDLMVNNESPGEYFGTVSYACSVAVSWTDSTNNASHTLALSPGLSEGVISTTLPAGGRIVWTSSGSHSNLQVAVQWQFERAVLIGH